MKELITYAYEAYDGTVFSNEPECRKYEEDLLSRTLGLVMLDDRKQKLPIDAEGYERATWVIVNKQADADYLIQLGKAYGYSTPWTRGLRREKTSEIKMGVYHYNGDTDTWENYDDTVSKILKEYAEVKAFRAE